VAHDDDGALVDRQLGQRAHELVGPALRRRRRDRGHGRGRHRVQPPRAGVVDRSVDDDAAQPRAERAPAVEAIERPQRGDERLLGDVLGGRRVVDDEPGGAVGARPVHGEKALERLRRAGLRGAHQLPLGTLDPLVAIAGRV
jgi:hypothetical protein